MGNILLPHPLDGRYCQCHYGARYAIDDAHQLRTTGDPCTSTTYSACRAARSKLLAKFTDSGYSLSRIALAARLRRQHGLMVIRTWPGGNYEIGTLADPNLPYLYRRPNCRIFQGHKTKNEATGFLP